MAKMKSLVGRPVRGSSSGRPIMALLDLLGRRWTLRLVWELRGEPHGFRDLQAACDGMSPSVLNQRLKELQEALILQTDPQGRYALSARGRELLGLFEPIYRWSESWAKALRR